MTGRKFAILGYPLGHTMSPVIHKRLFEMSGKLGAYEVCEIAPEDLEKSIGGLMQLDGFNVTIPHKLSVIRYLDGLSESASRYGAVNTVACGARCIGHNTDVDGFVRTIEKSRASLCSRVLLLGAGGAARMMAIETARNGGALTIAVRESDLPVAETVRADCLQQKPDADVQITELSQIHGEYDLLLQATPVGMYPHTGACVVPDEVIRSCGCVFDAIYNPSETLLMKKAREMGIEALGGMTMLVWQAVIAHEVWDGAHYDPSQIEALVEEMQRYVDSHFGA